MPILHARSRPRTVEDEDGDEVSISSEEALIHHGPIVEVSVGVAGSIAEEWRNSGRTVPEPISGPALIDTGATVTCVDQEAANELDVPAVDVVTMVSATEETDQRVYPIQMDVAGSQITFEAPRAVGANLEEQGLVALIGRDALRHATLHYNGVTGEFTLSM